MVLEEALRNSLILCEQGLVILKGRRLHFDKQTGYWRLACPCVGNRKYEILHRYLAKNLVPNPESLPYVNHLNGVKTDNRAVNLEWCTPAGNVRHALLTGLTPSNRIAVVAVHETTGDRLSFLHQMQACSEGFRNSSISMCISGKHKTHKGYRWYRADDPRLIDLT